MRKTAALLLPLVLLALLGGWILTAWGGLEADLEDLGESYYAAQDSRPFRMLNKSIFQKLLKNGWLEGLEDIRDPVWNYDTFTDYTVLGGEAVPSGETRYCCTFSAAGGRQGYLVVSYNGEGLGRVEAVETPRLYDLRADGAVIAAALAGTELDRSTTAAARVRFQDDGGVWQEGIQFQDEQGREWRYAF